MQERSRTVDDLVTRLKGMRRDHYEYLEVKQLAEILARHRAKVRLAIKEYRDLKRALSFENDAIEKLYLGYEGMFLRDHLRDALRLYVMVNRDFHEAYATYMEALKNEKLNPGVAIFAIDAKKAPFMPAAFVAPVANRIAKNTKLSQRRRNAA